MKAFYILLCSLLLVDISAHAQNLINNPKFDDYTTFLDSNNRIVYQPNSWYYNLKTPNHPIYFSSDMYLNNNKVMMPNHPIYFHSNIYEDKSFRYIYHPDSNLIKQGQKSNYISILILPNTQRAYTELIEPLKAGRKYHLQIDIKAYDQSTCISDLLVGFNDCLKCTIDSSLYQLRLAIPDSSSSSSYFDDWHTLNTNFIAKGNEKVFVVSSGSPDDYKKIIDSNLNKYLIYDYRWSSSYKLLYFVDNIILSEINVNQDTLVAQRYDFLDIGESVILQNIYFDFDKFDLLKESYSALNNVADYLDRNRNVQILVSGHTDNIGVNEYNDGLSSNRAKSVVDYLIGKGIAKDRLQSYGCGSKYPIESNDTEGGRQRNRRIEMTIIKK